MRVLVSRRGPQLAVIVVLVLSACAGGPPPSVPLADRQIAVLQLDAGPIGSAFGPASSWRTAICCVRARGTDGGGPPGARRQD